MSKIHLLKAKHGDAFIIECNKGDNKGVVVVDGGPGNCRTEIIKRLSRYESIDLLVLTHYDDDHIGGLISYIESKCNEVPFPVKEMWVNNALSKDFITDTNCSYGQAKTLADALTDISAKTEIIWKPYISEGTIKDFGFAQIEVVSPTLDMQTTRIEKYVEAVSVDLAATKRSSGDLQISMEELAKREKKDPDLGKPNELANACSIAFILRCDGLSILMLGDAYPQNIVSYLRNCNAKYSEENPLIVDYVKVSHHGSRNNISNELLDMIKCNNYIISTNGGLSRTNHPDREAIANILCHPKRDRSQKVHLYFNYPIETIVCNGDKFLNEDDKDLNFELHYNQTILPCED